MDIKKEILRVVSEITSKNVNESHFLTPLHKIANWNSLHHALILNQLEELFNIEFEIDELIGFQNLQEICDSIENKLNK